MKWVLLKSSVFIATRYDEKQQLLDLEFRSGAIHRYAGFPANLYDAFLCADSHGQYFHQHILGQFPDEQLRPPRRKRA